MATTTTGVSVSKVIAAMGAAVAAGLMFYGLQAGGEHEVMRTWALVIFAVSLFATHALPEHITALLVMFVALVADVAPANVVFSGFEVGALWLLFSGIIIGVAAQEAGLGLYVAKKILGRVRLTYVRAVILLVIAAFLMGFVIPATIPRIILMMPIALGLAQAMGFKEGGKGYTGLVFAMGVGTFGPTFAVVTANLPTMVHVGAMETVYGLKLSYSQYLLYHFPVTGIFRALALVTMLILLFREKETRISEEDSPVMTRTQKRLMVVLASALIIWGTDVWHGVHPAWVAMGAAIVILWPQAKLISPGAFKEKIDLSPVLYVGGILSIGAIMIANGLDKELGAFVLQWVDWSTDSDLINMYLIGLLSIAICLVATAPAAPVLLVPIASQISLATGISLGAVLMTEILGFSTTLMPYQGPPLVVLLSMCSAKVFDLVRLNLSVAAVMLILGFPLSFLWWRAIGLL